MNAARAAADLILLEHDLSVMQDAVVQGRSTVQNVSKYVLMGSSSNFGNMFSMAGAALFLPMLPIQILLNNLLYDVSEIAIPLDRVDPEATAQPVKWNGANEIVIDKLSHDTLTEKVGTTRSRVCFFMNRFHESGFVGYEGVGPLEVRFTDTSVPQAATPKLASADFYSDSTGDIPETVGTSLQGRARAALGRSGDDHRIASTRRNGK